MVEWSKVLPQTKKEGVVQKLNPVSNRFRILDSRIKDGDILTGEEIGQIRSTLLTIVDKLPYESLQHVEVNEEISEDSSHSTLTIRVKANIGREYLRRREGVVERALVDLETQLADYMLIQEELVNQRNLIRKLLETGDTDGRGSNEDGLGTNKEVS